MDNAMLDLDGFDWEYAELVRYAADAQRQEIDLAFVCPVAGWPARRWWRRLGRRLGIAVDEIPLDRHVTIQFRGVTDVLDHLTPWLGERGIVPSLDSHLEVELIDSVALDTGRYRFYLRCEDQRLEFTYQSCALLQEPIDRGQHATL